MMKATIKLIDLKAEVIIKEITIKQRNNHNNNKC